MPPAFVLSQDQTLILKEFRLTPVLSWFIVVISFQKLIKALELSRFTKVKLKTLALLGVYLI